MSRIWTSLGSVGLMGGLVVAFGTTATAQPEPLGLPGLVCPTTNCVPPTGDSQAPDPFLVKFDENGNATVSQNGGPPTTLKGTPWPTLQTAQGSRLP
jgi:hypothetical protein